MRRNPASRTAIGTVLFCAFGLSCASGVDERAKALEQAEFHYGLASGFYSENELNRAVGELATALEKNPDHANAHHLMAVVRMARREFYDAMSHAKKAVELKPDFHEARHNLGASYLALCRWEDAVSLYTELVEEPRYSTPWFAHNNLGWALWQLDRRSDAIRHFKRAVFFNPKFCLGFNNLGIAFLEEGRYDDAARQLEKALSVDETCKAGYAEPHLHLARLSERKGDGVKACEQLRACVEKAPPGEEQAPTGCGHTPVGKRCERKASQLGCPAARP